MNLTTWDREHIRINVNNLRGLSVAKLRDALGALKAVELTGDEQKQIGYETTQDGARWEKDGYAKEIAFTDSERELVRGVVEGTVKMQAGAGLFSVNHAQRLVQLCAKLDLDFWEIGARAEEELESRNAAKEAQGDGGEPGPVDIDDA